MKVFVYSYRDFDEGEIFTRYSNEYGIELGICRDAPTLENAYLAEGYEYLSIITTEIDADLVTRFHELGVKMISTRTVGYDHIDLHKAEELGVQVGNATYSPNCVADYTIMLMLMSVRKMKRIMERANINDFSLPGNQGREMPNLTIGIIGTGKIGRTVIKYLSGFGCKVYAYDLFKHDDVKKYAEYVELDTIYANCDMISIHMPLGDSNYHLINQDSIAKMKDKVIIINTARGGIIDSAALIEGLESGKIGAAGLDVVEKEFGLYYYDLKSQVLDNRELMILRSYPNVIVTPHMAFYTDQAIDDMVHHSIKSCWLVEHGKENPWQVRCSR
ncbi:MAG: D-isomer specific 2-hydroxyacid dehydrogenase, NAD-binding [Massilibacillus sp.]|jgi:D-lactate dehydrogenase|nr:D-isomer specific 2-hydroxyacid dehydrogenase, NAD-binding [Massilibacillus sp.]